MNVYLPNLRLPSAYQEVEYIQSSGTNGSSGQYINTGIIPEPANTVVKLRTMPISSSYSIYLCSCMKTYGTAQTNRYYGLSFTANRWHCGYGTADTTPGHPLVDFSYTWNWGNTIYDVEYRNDDLYVNNTLVANATTNVSNFQYPMFLFARNNGGTAGSFSSFKLYSCKIYKSGTLVRDFIPCYRKSDSVIGLYDLVNNQFYTNAGTGTFSKGNDVTMAELKNAYIGEYKGYKPGANTIAWWKLEGDFKDYSGNNRDLTNSGVTFTSGGPSQVAVFSGNSNAYYQNQSLFNISYPFTFNTWAKASSIGSYNYVCIGVQNGTDLSMHDKELGFSSSSYVFSYIWAGSTRTLLSSKTVSTNTWYNLIYTYDGSNQKIYMNGELVGTLSTSSSHTGYSSARLTLSKSASSGSTHPFNGNLSHVIIENKARSGDEASEYYNGTKSNYGL